MYRVFFNFFKKNGKNLRKNEIFEGILEKISKI
jgi:hypothetical protein